MTLFERMSELATCLCAQIEADGSPQPCFCGVIPGQGAVADYAGNCNTACGMAWVRMVTMLPMQGVGKQNETPGNCGSELGAVIEVGIFRCISVGDQRNPVPTPAELLAATEQQVADAYTMQRAIVCCPAFSSKDMILGAYQPTGPSGGLVGGTFQVTLV